jgi:hypothetical protein
MTSLTQMCFTTCVILIRWVEQDAKELLTSVEICLETVASRLTDRNIPLDNIKVQPLGQEGSFTFF